VVVIKLLSSIYSKAMSYAYMKVLCTYRYTEEMFMQNITTVTTILDIHVHICTQNVTETCTLFNYINNEGGER
jgi:hypothetical protein